MKNFCQVFYLRDKKKTSCQNTKLFWLGNKWEGKGYKEWIHLSFELFLHCMSNRRKQVSYRSELYCPTTSTLCTVSQVCGEPTGLLRLQRANQQRYTLIKWPFLPCWLFLSPMIPAIHIYAKRRNTPELHAENAVGEPHSESHHRQYACLDVLSGHV